MILMLLLLAVESRAMEFVGSPYTAAIDEASLQTQEIVQQVVAIPSGPLSNVTYSIEPNKYVDINSLTGEVSWKGQKILLKDINLVVSAQDSMTQSKMETNLTLSSSKESCPCFISDLQELSVNIPENLAPSSLLFLSPSRCSENAYNITSKEAQGFLHIEEGRLMVHPFDYETTESLQTAVTCQNKTLTVIINVKNEVDLPPYTEDRKLGIITDFMQFNYTVDEHQLDSMLGDKKQKILQLHMDASGSDDKLRVIPDPHQQLIVTKKRPFNIVKGGYKPVFFYVTHANSLQIDKSTDIDIIIVDDNIVSDKGRTINNNVTFRFSLTLEDVDELNSLDLLPTYNIELFENSPAFSQVLRVAHDFTRALHFELILVSSDRAHCRDILSVTTHQGIVYVNEKGIISQCHNAAVEYKLKVSQNGSSASRESALTITWAPSPNVTGSPQVSCADYTNEDSCESGQGLGSSNCMWRHVINSKSNFSTCVPNNECGNMECSELETLHGSICPQDCLDSNGWAGVLSVACGRTHLGICSAAGVCYCEDNTKYCKCLPEDKVGKYIFGNNSHEGNVTSVIVNNKGHYESPVPVYSSCGIECTVSISVIVAVAIIIIAVISLWYKYKPTKHIHKVEDGINAYRVGGRMHFDTNLTDNPDYEGSTPSTVHSEFTEWPDSLYHNTGNMELFDEKWELCRENLIIGDYIGEGEFGRVVKATYRTCLLDDWSPVAVKMLKDGASRTEYNDLLSEYNLLKEVNHPNVIKLIGAATINGPFHLVVEYCELGSLKSYLRSIRTQEPDYINAACEFYSEYASQLMSFSYQISKGMQYLSGIKLVHRDLATRNILISAEKVIKISDFGMTKDIYEENAYKKKGQGRIPVKWMAPESLYHLTYTAKSDVWSFGVLLWEIATLGATPYPGIPAERMFNLLQEGYRMCRPETCSPQLYSLMRKCWEYEEAGRPSFKELSISLEKMVEDKNSTYLDLSVAIASRRPCHGSSNLSNSSADSEVQQLTVALLPNAETKFVEDYLVSSNGLDDKAERQPLRYTTLEFADEE